MKPKPVRPDTMFKWLEDMNLQQLTDQRKQLAGRISLLPERSHKRIELEAMAAALCRRQLELEIAQDETGARK